MKKYLFLILLALGLVAFVPQKAKAEGYLGISVGPAYCDPYPDLRCEGRGFASSPSRAVRP